MDGVVARICAVLEGFYQGEELVPFNELANRVGLARSTTHRLLADLVECGYVAKVGRGHYRLGLKTWELGCRALSALPLDEAARPHLQWLAQMTDETVFMAILQGRRVLYISRFISPIAVAVNIALGQTSPAFCTATGKAMLAFSPLPVIKAALEPPLEACTPKTNTDPAAIRAILEQVRVSGVAINFGEATPDVTSIAVPVLDHTGYATAAVGVVAPAYRFRRETIEMVTHAVLKVGPELSATLGYTKSFPGASDDKGGTTANPGTLLETKFSAHSSTSEATKA